MDRLDLDADELSGDLDLDYVGLLWLRLSEAGVRPDPQGRFTRGASPQQTVTWA